MATFLEKNKKKSALAALLLFLRTRKTVIALLLLVALASFVFIGPASLMLHFPGGARLAAGVAWIAGKVGVDTSRWGLAGGKRDYVDLLAAFQAAKAGGAKVGWTAFMGGNGGDASGAGSLGFVKGNAKDLEALDGSGAKLAKPGSVEGVLNPDDAKNRGEGEGVALSENDLSGARAGLVKSAFAGGFGNSARGGEAALSGGAFANSGFFGGGNGGNGNGAVTTKLGDLVKGALGEVNPATGKGAPVKGGASGRLSSSRASQINARSAKGLVGTHTISGQRAFVQLAAQRGRSAVSVSPNCTADSGCPAEFASVNTGAVYDGNSISGERTDIISAPNIDDISSPNLPDSGMADDYIRDAEKMEADAKKCRELDDKYGPQELAFDKQQEEMSNRFDSMGCGQGGCSKSKAKKCKALGNEMKALCRASMTVRCEHIHACPLTANNACSPSDCDGGAPRAKKKVVLVNDGVRTSTQDQGEASQEESQECLDARGRIAAAREAAENSLKDYRENGCEFLYTSQLIVDKLKYTAKCTGREIQTVSTCKNYGRVVCLSNQACSGGECEGDAPECNISNLPVLEDFITK